MKKQTKTNKTTKTMITAAALGLLTASNALAVDPYAKPNNSWISISGKVKNVTADAFTLDYGKGTITVEMDDWDNDADGYKLVDGDKVNVYGNVDADLYQKRTIEAGSVYVENLGTYFYASSDDEEDYVYPTFVATVPIVVGSYQLTGTVSEVNGREFTVSTGTSKTIVDTDEMAYNPMDDVGFQKISKGDRVRVYGSIDIDLFEKTEIKAKTIITLKDKSEKKK